MNRARVLPILAGIAGTAALITELIHVALTSIERALTEYTVEVPDVVPLWLDEYLDLP